MATGCSINYKNYKTRYAPRRHEEHEGKMTKKRQCYLSVNVAVINIIELWIDQSKQLLKTFILQFIYKHEIPDSYFAFNSSCPS